MGWCNAFQNKYGRSWGEFVCFMEAQYGISSDCIAADVPCMAYSAEIEDKEEDNYNITNMALLIALFILSCVLRLANGSSAIITR